MSAAGSKRDWARIQFFMVDLRGEEFRQEIVVALRPAGESLPGRYTADIGRIEVVDAGDGDGLGGVPVGGREDEA